VTAAEPLILPEIDAGALSILNELAGTNRKFAIAIGNETFEVRFVPAPSLASGLAALISVGGRPLWLAFSDWSQFAAVAELLDGELLDRLPTAVMPAVLNAAFEKNLDQLAQLGGAPGQVDAVVANDQLPSDLFGIGIELTGQGKAIHGCVFADTDAWSLLRDAVMRVAPVAARSHAQLPMAAGVEVGLTQLPVGDLRTVMRGDVILFDVAAPRDKPSGLLRFAPTATWRASLAGESATLTEQVKLAHWGRDAAAGKSVTLVFEQGHVECTAEQVARLQSGASLPRVGVEEITIRNGDQLVGVGELVLLGNRTGVRAKSWPAR
jgi:flagellar motor switch/type III secretory pathway protein FliN